MLTNTGKLKQQALSLLQNACCSYGILASPDEQDNYRRLWARDSMIAGIAGLMADDEKIINGFKNAIQTLAEYQHPFGMIPSNVLPAKSPEVSYGGLAGRVDATTWFVVGTCLYLSKTNNENFQRRLQPNLMQALEILNRWEFNAKGLLYTPLSGNWADEYPVEGHTLYDNCLRLWGLELYAKVFADKKRSEQAKHIRECIAINFWPHKNLSDHPAVYHRRSFKEAVGNQPRYFACSIGPKGYNYRFDAAGHALALLLELADEQQKSMIEKYIGSVFEAIGAELLPAFWPVIEKDDPEWLALKQNYSFDFKNKPHNFHNGGIWPVWMGLFALGMSQTGSTAITEKMLEAWMEIEDPESITFAEYIASDSLKMGGKLRLSYSASGLLFLLSAIEQDQPLRQLVL